MSKRIYNLFKGLLERDYIVEQGLDETTGFYYRKWNSGFAECWTTWNGTVTSYIENLGGNKTYGITKTFNLPFHMLNNVANADVLIGSNIAGVARIWAGNTNVGVVAESASRNVQATYYISVKGLWKALESRGGGTPT